MAPDAGGARRALLLCSLLAAGLPSCRERTEPAAGGAPDTLAVATTGSLEHAGIETRVWRNDPARMPPAKRAHYRPFIFRYPASWTVIEDGSGESPNFVKVERATPDRFTLENFAVGWYAEAGADEVLATMEPRFAASFPGYARVADEAMVVGGTTSRGFRFRSTVESERGALAYWGLVLARPAGPDHGLLLIMFASELAPGVTRAEEVGRAGELPVILDSFRDE